jgi:hypothetical protein
VDYVEMSDPFEIPIFIYTLNVTFKCL